MPLLVAALLALQQNQTATRNEKTEYEPAQRACLQAEALVESDPRGAIEKLDPLLVNPKLVKIECRLRVELRPSEYTDWSMFLPYQYRGRARLNLAKKAPPEQAQKLAADAVADLEESVKRGIAPSQDFLDAAKGELAKAKAAVAAAAAKPAPGEPPKEDPALKVRPAWQRLVDEKKFKSARATLETEGKALPEADRKALAEDTDRQCRAMLNARLVEFRRTLAGLRTEADLTGLTGAEFDDAFALPAPAELSATVPAYDWAVQQKALLKRVQSKQAPASALLEAALAAAPLETAAENPWFRPLEALAFQNLRDAVSARVDQARDAARADRDRLRKEAEDARKQWADFAAKLDPKFRELHRLDARSAELAKLFDGFPADLAALEKLDLEAVFRAEAPEAALAALEAELRGHESKAGVSRESRQRLYTALVTVLSLRGFLEGKEEDAVAQSLGTYRLRLSAVGGPTDPKRFGERVGKVFELLK
jgi:hypothetical protein